MAASGQRLLCLGYVYSSTSRCVCVAVAESAYTTVNVQLVTYTMHRARSDILSQQADIQIRIDAQKVAVRVGYVGFGSTWTCAHSVGRLAA